MVVDRSERDNVLAAQKSPALIVHNVQAQGAFGGFAGETPALL